jgi:HD superfamily phosphodiesterase
MVENKSWQLWIPILEQELEKEMEKTPAISDAHKADHVQRVWRRSRKIGEGLGADLEILVVAAYLHDLGRHHVQDKAHGALSADLAKPVL